VDSPAKVPRDSQPTRSYRTVRHRLLATFWVVLVLEALLFVWGLATLRVGGSEWGYPMSVWMCTGWAPAPLALVLAIAHERQWADDRGAALWAGIFLVIGCVYLFSVYAVNMMAIG